MRSSRGESRKKQLAYQVSYEAHFDRVFAKFTLQVLKSSRCLKMKADRHLEYKGPFYAGSFIGRVPTWTSMNTAQPFLGNHCITKPGNLLFHDAHSPCISLGALEASGAMQGLQGSQRLFGFELAQFVTGRGTYMSRVRAHVNYTRKRTNLTRKQRAVLNGADMPWIAWVILDCLRSDCK